jgi:DNA ligase 4
MYHRLEGLVLKPADSPYFTFGADESTESIEYFIKVKKDYMQELGGERDVGDFAVIGASYDPKLAFKVGINNLKFTHFYLGCVVNSDDIRFGKAAQYEVVACIEVGPCIPKPELVALNSYAQFHDTNDDTRREMTCSFQINPPGDYKISSLFTMPCVVEVLGSAYDKPSNKNYFMLRHPRILKYHSDRSWKDAVTFGELQQMADKARKEPTQGESQELRLELVKMQRRYDAKRAKESRRSFQISSSRSPLSELDQVSPQRSLPNSFCGRDNDELRKRKLEDLRIDGNDTPGNKQQKVF